MPGSPLEHEQGAPREQARFRRRHAGGGISAVGTLAVGPASAYAVHNVKDYNTTVWGTDGVNLHSTPSVKPKSKGLMVDKSTQGC